MIGVRRIDPEIKKLEAQIALGRFTDAQGRVADAAMHLRLAINLVVDLDTSPDVSLAAESMDQAATVLLRWLDANTAKETR